MAGPGQLPAGREEDVRRVVAALTAEPRRTSSVVILGEAGIGKSTVLEAVLDRVPPQLRVQAAERDRPLAYYALADLIGPHMDSLAPHLAPARRAALLGALGFGEPGSGNAGAAGHGAAGWELRMAALATRDALMSMAKEGGFVVAIDDAQWLDHESASCLSFAARRVAERGVRLIVTARSGGTGAELPLGLTPGQPDLEVLRLGGLEPGALGVVVAQHLGRSIPRPTLMHVHDLSHGNPLLALEIVRLLPPDATVDTLPEDPEVGRLIGRRVRDLRPETIDLLLLAAAATHPTIDLLCRVTGEPGHVVAARLGPRAADGLVDVRDGAVSFAHPLFLAAVLQSVSPGARAQAHARLADVTLGPEQALHLADSALGPDETVAAQVEAAAAHAASRGARSAAALLLERAAALSPDALDQGRRLLEASEGFRLAGDASRADRLAGLAAAALPPCGIRGRARAALFTPTVTAEELDAAVRDAEGDDAALAVIFDRHAEAAFLRLDLPAAVGSTWKSVEAAERTGDRALLAHVLAAGAETLGLVEPGAGTPWLLRAAELGATTHGYYSPATAIAGLQKCADELGRAREGLRAEADHCRASGDDLGRSGLLMHLIEVETRSGNLVAAHALAVEHAELSAGLGSWQAPYLADYVQALVLAYEGIGDRAVALALRGLAMAEAVQDWAFSVELRYAAGLGHLALGEHPQAVEMLSAARQRMDDAGFGEVGVCPLHADEIEACVGAGQFDRAWELSERLSEVGRRLDRPRLIGGALVGSGLCLASTGSAADGVERINRGVELLADAGLIWEATRARLALGTALRRHRERSRARQVLARAASGFLDMGAPGWASRARDESARVSGRSPAPGSLTPTEERIVALVAAGLSNREAADQLFMSPKTVEGYLTHIYRKLGVSRRAQLAALPRDPV